MAKAAQKFKAININLLKPQGIKPKIPVRFLKWLLAYGRYIVVVVEIVVVSAFIFRFKLDADLASLKEEINSLIPYVESLSNDEALIKQTHLRLRVIKESYASNPSWQDIFLKISSQMPTSIKLTNLNFSSNTGPLVFKLTGQTPSNNHIAALLSSLKEDKTFTDIKLTNLNFSEGQIIFSITGGVK